MENKDMPAYPQSVSSNEAGIYLATDANINDKAQVTGITKREAFAMAAMQGLMFFFGTDGHERDHAEAIARKAIRTTDAILAELSKPQP